MFSFAGGFVIGWLAASAVWFGWFLAGFSRDIELDDEDYVEELWEKKDYE